MPSDDPRGWLALLEAGVLYLGPVGVAALVAWFLWLRRPRGGAGNGNGHSNEHSNGHDDDPSTAPNVYRLSLRRVAELERRLDQARLEADMLRQRLVNLRLQMGEPFPTDQINDDQQKDEPQ